MDATMLEQWLRKDRGWRVGPHTLQYISNRAANPIAQAFTVQANDARTGVPVEGTLNAGELPKAPAPVR